MKAGECYDPLCEKHQPKPTTSEPMPVPCDTHIIDLRQPKPRKQDRVNADAASAATPTTGDLDCPLSELVSPKPTGEWTPEWLANFGKADNWLESICEAHNAALAAERGKAQRHPQRVSSAALSEAYDEIQQLSEQLDVAREALKMLKYDQFGIPLTYPSKSATAVALSKIGGKQ